MKESLLEFLFDETGEECLSDLKIQIVFQKYIPLVNKIKHDEFTLDEWNYLYQYLTNEDIAYSTREEVKNHINKWATE